MYALVGKRKLNGGPHKAFILVGFVICPMALTSPAIPKISRSAIPDSPSPQVSSLSRYLVVRARINSEQEAKRIGNKLVIDYLGTMGGRATFLNKEFEDVVGADCKTGTCEIVRVTIEEKSYKVTYGIESHLLPAAPDRPIWEAREPASCDVSQDRPATECVDHLLRVLGNKIVAHDMNVHRQPQ